jgi:hypothetical protein
VFLTVVAWFWDCLRLWRLPPHLVACRPPGSSFFTLPLFRSIPYYFSLSLIVFRCLSLFLVVFRYLSPSPATFPCPSPSFTIPHCLSPPLVASRCFLLLRAISHRLLLPQAVSHCFLLLLAVPRRPSPSSTISSCFLLIPCYLPLPLVISRPLEQPRATPRRGGVYNGLPS